MLTETTGILSVIEINNNQRELAIITNMLRLLAGFLAALIAAVLLVVIALIRSTYDWMLWPAIRRARRNIEVVARQRVATVEVVSHQGATRISPGYLTFCLKTQTDKERDILCHDPAIHQQFRDALVKAGYPSETRPVVHFVIQSQETAEQDYGGNWYEASGML